MLWVLKRTVSMRRFFKHPKHMLKMMGKKIITILHAKILLNWTYVYVPFICFGKQDPGIKFISEMTENSEVSL